TGYNTVSTDSISVKSNQYLEEIEQWDERELPYYKRKVRGKIFSGYVSIVPALLLVYLCYYVVTAIGYVAYENLEKLLKDVPALQWGIIALFALLVFFIVFRVAKKSMINFIDSCHGEIAHEGSPFVKKLKVNLVISIILMLAGIGYFVYSALQANAIENANILQTFMFAPAFIAPMAYFIASIVARDELTECPVCGRYNTVFRVKSSADFGEKKDGEHNEREYRSERVGTTITTTHWSDGSTTKSTSPIYGSVAYTKVYSDYSNLSKYTYYCHECSYVEETLEEKTWKVLKSKYRG
ncbi:MAG: hypothetical protein IJW13_00335, partial [Clostridia bacterium]|nr:hypothetical protein [Clostridia bacterium]